MITLKHKIISVSMLILLFMVMSTLSFASNPLFGSSGSIDLEGDKDKEILKEAMKILAEAGEIDGVKTLGIVEGVSNEEAVVKILMKAKDKVENLNGSNEEAFEQYIQSVNAENMNEFKQVNNRLLALPETKFLMDALEMYDNDLAAAGELAKSKLQLDKEATEQLGLSEIPADILDKLFDEVYDQNIAIENMSENQKKYLEKTGKLYAFQLQATDLAKDISKVVGSDTKDWAELIKIANDPAALKAKYGEGFQFSNDVEGNIKEIVKSIEGSRDSIYDQILKVSEFNQSLIDPAEYKSLIKQYGIDEFVLSALGSDPKIKDLMQNNPEYIKLLEMYEEYRNKYGLDYKTDISASNTIDFGQEGNGSLEIVDSLSQKNFHVIGKVVFKITKKSGGSIGGLSLLNDKRLQEIAKEYSGIGNEYYNATGRYIPVFKEISRDYSSVTYEINYTEGADFDDLREYLSPVYQKYDPTIGIRVTSDGIYKIETEIYANTLTELMDVHAAHDYSWTTGTGPTLQSFTETCEEIKYWPYKQRIVDFGVNGAHVVQYHLSNKTPDSVKENTWIGSVEWEVNAKAGDVEIPLMGQVVSKTSIITN